MYTYTQSYLQVHTPTFLGMCNIAATTTTIPKNSMLLHLREGTLSLSHTHIHTHTHEPHLPSRALALTPALHHPEEAMTHTAAPHTSSNRSELTEPAMFSAEEMLWQRVQRRQCLLKPQLPIILHTTHLLPSNHPYCLALLSPALPPRAQGILVLMRPNQENTHVATAARWGIWRSGSVGG